MLKSSVFLDEKLAHYWNVFFIFTSISRSPRAVLSKSVLFPAQSQFLLFAYLTNRASLTSSFQTKFRAHFRTYFRPYNIRTFELTFELTTFELSNSFGKMSHFLNSNYVRDFFRCFVCCTLTLEIQFGESDHKQNASIPRWLICW